MLWDSLRLPIDFLKNSPQGNRKCLIFSAPAQTNLILNKSYIGLICVAFVKSSIIAFEMQFKCIEMQHGNT